MILAQPEWVADDSLAEPDGVFFTEPDQEDFINFSAEIKEDFFDDPDCSLLFFIKSKHFVWAKFKVYPSLYISHLFLS